MFQIVCVLQVAQDAINDARSICMREYGAAPDVSIYGDPSFVFAYVPSHLHHMVFELVKNSLRAVQDRFEDADDEPPPIRCAICVLLLSGSQVGGVEPKGR
jgi:pyruvate dehydrogenase kinase 2/3/4